MTRQAQITESLHEALTVSHLELENESHMHSVPPNSETHFKLVLVSPEFEGLNKVKRHQKVYQILNRFMQEGLHALALHLFTPEEWNTNENSAVPASPNCMGGSKHDS